MEGKDMKTTKRRQFLKAGLVGSAGFLSSSFIQGADAAQAQSDILATFKTRRSVRKFKPSDVCQTENLLLMGFSLEGTSSGMPQEIMLLPMM